MKNCSTENKKKKQSLVKKNNHA